MQHTRKIQQIKKNLKNLNVNLNSTNSGIFSSLTWKAEIPDQTEIIYYTKHFSSVLLKAKLQNLVFKN